MTTIADKLQLKVGGDACISDAYSRLKIGKVTQITPTGQVTVRVEYSNGTAPTIYRFKPNGNQIDPQSLWRFANLISKEDYARGIKARRRENQQARFVQELKAFGNWSATNAELPSKLEDFAKRLRSWQLES